MTAKQISLRSLFVVTLIVALATTVIQLIAANASEMFIFASIVSAVLALTGLGIIGFAMLIVFSVLLTPEDGNRKHNLYRCCNLVGIGFLAIVPFVIWIVILPHTM